MTTWSLVKEFRADRTERQVADVSRLRQNTHYEFRVVPMLEVAVGNPLEGRPSPISSSVRTLCGGQLSLDFKTPNKTAQIHLYLIILLKIII